jgi:hypothetical protein
MADRSQLTDRRRWPVRRFTLDTQPGHDLSGETTEEERLEMMWPLALEAWTLTGAALPDYSRRDAPVHVLPMAASPRARRT